jgi:hypothetical protein
MSTESGREIPGAGMSKQAIWLIAVLLSCRLAWAEEGGEAGSNDSDKRRHRVDISALYTDAKSRDALNGIFGYTYNLAGTSNLSVAVPYLDPDLDTGGDSGIGDAMVSWSFVPYYSISANPWVPRTVGSGIAVLMPTGDVDKGRSLDTWVAYPFLGFVHPLTDRFFIAPRLGYIHSLGATVLGEDLRLISAEIGASFVAFDGFWVSYFPRFIHDLQTHERAINHMFSVGKQFAGGFGISLDYTALDRVDFGSDQPPQGGFNDMIEVNFHFRF